ncbi:MAG: methyltransferase [Gammaproteobacteria bacterium]
MIQAYKLLHTFPWWLMKTRLYALDDFLHRHAYLWRAQPFKIERPDWCATFPELTRSLLALSDTEVAQLERTPQSLRDFVSRFIPQLQALDEFCFFPPLAESVAPLPEARFGWEVPGRKQAQIWAFSQAIECVPAPLLEWCGGKGHLGRSLALLWQQPVETLEWDASLCDAGKRLAARVNVQQAFHVKDALQPTTLAHARQKHVVALHACGALHRQLVASTATENIPALDIAPCCYHLGSAARYRAFNPDLCLRMQRDDLRLAVTNSDTAAATQIRSRQREMAWKLGFEALRRQQQPATPYRSIRPINKSWLKGDFAGFCQQLAMRESLALPRQVDWSSLEQQGWQRQHDVVRLDLLRFAFRRPLEVWLVLDMAVFLEQQGYTVSVREFCPQGVTPRNLLISAH